MKLKHSLETQIWVAHCNVRYAMKHKIQRLPELFTKLADLLRKQLCLEGK